VRLRRATSVLVTAVLLGLAGCGGGSGDESLLGSDASPSDPAHATAADRPVQRLLDRRAGAVLDGDERAFLAPVAPGERALLVEQRRLFDNLRRLPVEALAFTPDADGRILRALTLRGFDRAPEVGTAGFAVERRAGRLRVVPADPADRPTDPWDLTEIDVRSTPHVLVVLDRASAARADDVVAAVSDGIDDVAGEVPGDWDRTAVVYVIRSPAVLASYARVPGGNLQHLGAVSFPVRGGAGGRTVVGTRVALLPSAMDAGTSELRRVVRHELTHVAIGTRADGAPLWLSEGIAEYVAALPIPPARRRIATVAVDAASAGVVVLPDAASFNDSDQDLHYSVAWMACDYLAAERGDAVLWELLSAMRRAHVGRGGAGQDAVLRRVVGLDSQQLANRASARIIDQFGH
jgi:hypothetical protein